MREHKYIWLQPECCADTEIGRMWCEDPDPVDCDDGKPWTKYILASEHESLERQLEFSNTLREGMAATIDTLRSDLERVTAERDGARRVMDAAVKYVQRSSGENIDSYPEFLKLKLEVDLIPTPQGAEREPDRE